MGALESLFMAGIARGISPEAKAAIISTPHSTLFHQDRRKNARSDFSLSLHAFISQLGEREKSLGHSGNDWWPADAERERERRKEIQINYSHLSFLILLFFLSLLLAWKHFNFLTFYCRKSGGSQANAAAAVFLHPKALTKKKKKEKRLHFNTLPERIYVSDIPPDFMTLIYFSFAPQKRKKHKLAFICTRPLFYFPG